MTMMTVGELRKQLEGLDPKINVGIFRETHNGAEFFDITYVTVMTGTASRNEHTYKASFTAEPGGEKWVLISFEDA